MKKSLIMKSLSVILVIAIVVSVVLLDNKYNLRHFFDDFESETDESFLQIVNYSNVYDKNGVKLFQGEDVEFGSPSTVFCCINDRIYYGYSTYPSEMRGYKLWHIASVDLQGNHFVEHYSGLLSDRDISIDDLSCWSLSERDFRFGGRYDGEGKIYLTGNVKTICYNIVTDKVEEIDVMPEMPYDWQHSKDLRSLTITKGTEERTVTFESLAQTNEYAKQIYKLSSYKTGGIPYLCRIDVEMNQGDIYIICTVLNWWGHGYNVVYRYDFETEKAQYIMHVKMWDPADNYNVVLKEEKL